MEHEDDNDASAGLGPETDDIIDGMEFSLDQLGQAYAQLMRDSSIAPEAEEFEELQGETAPIETPENEELNDEQDNATCPISETSVLESILFVGTPPGVKLTAKKLAGMLRDVSPKEIKQIVARLNERYQQEHSVLQIVQHDGGYRMEVAQQALKWREKFQGEVRDAHLNQQVIDVLAIIAYQQPVGRKQIEAVRQKPCGAAIQQLLHRRLIEIEESASQPRNPHYRTAPRFLELFGLEVIDDLPQAQEVEAIDEFLDD